jgi:hypothetical protein
MRIFKRCNTLIVALTFVPAVLFGFDLPGYATFHGKIIDADTLKPIEGAVVWAIWNSCGPGLGHGPVCSVGIVKEVLTDADGEWQITGPKGNSDPGFIRSILGFLVPWTGSPQIGYYKPGYFPFLAKLGIGDFSAHAYVDKAKNIEGIILYRRDSMEEWKRYLELSKQDGSSTLIPAKDPERKLRELNYDFKYPSDVRRVCDRITDKTTYKVIGLKKAITSEEKREARGLGINDIYPDADQSLLRKALKY